jgi:putative peptidoglycan lipid II flippase
VVLGGVVQLFIQIPSLIKKGFKYRFYLSWKGEGVGKVFKLIFPAILGSITLQVSVVVTRIFASTLPPGGISGLQYAMRLIQFPLGLFPIALSTAIFPRFSSLVAIKDMGGLKEAVNMGVRMVFFLLLPSAVGLILLRKELVSLLFQYGAFSYQDTLLTSEALFCYSLGLFAMGGVMILTRAFYSLQDMITPLKVFLLCLGVNIVLNFVLIGPLKHRGLALATSLSIILNMGLLAFWLREKLGGIGGYSIFLSFVRTLSISALMGGGIYFILSFLTRLNPAFSLGYRIAVLVLSLITGVGIVAVVSYLTQAEEFKLIVRSLRR